MEKQYIHIQIDPHLDFDSLMFVEIWNAETETSILGHAQIKTTSDRGMMEIMQIVVESDISQTVATTVLTALVQKIIDRLFREKKREDDIDIQIIEKDTTKKVRIKSKNRTNEKRK